MTETHWSEDRIVTLKSLWLDGLSASQIAKSLGGVTRNAVIGKVHRLGLSGRAMPSCPSRPARPPRQTKPAPRPKPQPVRQGPGLISSLTALGAHACKWPIGDPKAADFSFCGAPANGSYCRSHQAEAFLPGTAWRAERDPSVRRALAGIS